MIGISHRLRQAARAWSHEEMNGNVDKLLIEAADEIDRLRVENIQMQAALGYAILAEDERHIIPVNPFKCGTCDARRVALEDK